MRNEAAWKRLGELLQERRIDLGYPRRGPWVRRVLGLSHDRTHSDIENGRRDNYDPSTLADLEYHYQLNRGAIAWALAGRPLDTHEMGYGSHFLDSRSGSDLMSIDEIRAIETASLARRFPERADRGLTELYEGTVIFGNAVRRTHPKLELDAVRLIRSAADLYSSALAERAEGGDGDADATGSAAPIDEPVAALEDENNPPGASEDAD